MTNQIDSDNNLDTNNISKRLIKIEKSQLSFINKEEKIIIDKEIKEIKNLIELINSDKSKIEYQLENQDSDLQRVNKDLNNLNFKKVDKTSFEESLRQIRELSKQFKELDSN